MKFFWIICCVAVALPLRAAEQAKFTYDEHVRPILKEHCLGCHNPDEAEADLNLASFAGLMAGSSSGKIVLPGRANSSKLIQVVTHADEPKMPPENDPIPAEQIGVLRGWIESGLLENSGSVAKHGSSVLFAIAATSLGKPDGPPPMPTSLPDVELPATRRPMPITAMAASPWAPLVAVSGHERVLLYHSDTGALVGVLPFPERIPFVLRFSQSGELLLAAGGRGAQAGKAVVWNVKSGARVAEIGDEYDSVLAADISADLKYVALGGPSRIVKLFSANDGKLLTRIDKHTDWITALAFSPDGKLLATGDRAGGIHVWEAGTGGIYATYAEHQMRITALAWRGDGKVLASAGDDGRLILWDTQEGWPVESLATHAKSAKSYSAHERGVLSVAYARDGRLVTTGRDRTIVLREGNGAPLRVYPSEDSLPTAGLFSHDDQRILAGDYRGRVRIFSTDKDEPLITIDGSSDSD